MFLNRLLLILPAAVLGLLAGAGCATVNAKNAPADECVVTSTPVGLTGASATITDNEATTQGFGFKRKIAALREGGKIVYLAREAEKDAGEVRDGRLNMTAGRSGASEPIANGVRMNACAAGCAPSSRRPA